MILAIAQNGFYAVRLVANLTQWPIWPVANLAIYKNPTSDV
jgi:hypothetical protein